MKNFNLQTSRVFETKNESLDYLKRILLSNDIKEILHKKFWACYDSIIFLRTFSNLSRSAGILPAKIARAI